MIKTKAMLLAAAVMGVMAVGQNAQASVVLSGTATWISPAPTDISVNYWVDLTGSTYTYVYSFTDVTTPGTSVNLNAFEVDASYVSSVAVAGAVLPSGLGTATVGGAVQLGDVFWTLAPLSPGQSATVAYYSLYGPTMGSGSAIDGAAGPWSSQQPGGQLVPVPAPVPEATTVMAGLLMLLPLGFGVVRSLRKERAV